MVLPTDPPLLSPGMRTDVLPAIIAQVISLRTCSIHPVSHLPKAPHPLPTDTTDTTGSLGTEWALPAIPEWRCSNRVKTVAVGIVVCLNIGVTPPDQPKPENAAKLHAWIDPFKDIPSKALEQIGKTLQAQYEVLHPRARYRLALDATIDDTKKLCMNLRRSAKDERVLFHYNGHGVPKPTLSGELWVFNKTYTQYIPVSVYDLQSWLGTPAVYIWDCNSAATILHSFNQFVTQRETEARSAGAVSALFSESIQLAACSSNESVPWTPNLPADVFTACLTTPITMALRWFLLTHHHARVKCPLHLTFKVPGRLNDRRTPLGELNWIFTAVTDTIAWNILPRNLFRRLFRQDLLVAGLFRNYLLAHRILRHYNCNPVTSPVLPDTDMHPLWAAWDMVVDLVVDQLPSLVGPQTPSHLSNLKAVTPISPAPNHSPVEYTPSAFFAEQLSAFDIWITQAPAAKRPPLQLPIVLQVLLSQHHRLRALIILSRFLDQGPWAVAEALQVGIFPYVLKLLQSPAPELKPVLVFIWTRILAVDPSNCQQDLMKDTGFAYFVHALSPSANLVAVTDVSEHRAMCTFILATICHGFREGQASCLHHSVLPLAAQYLSDHDDLLRQWACICIAQICHQYSDAILAALEDGLHQKIMAHCLTDAVTEVRAAAVLALGTFLQLASPQLQPMSLDMVTSLLSTLSDASPMVRTEGIIALACFASHHRTWFEATADTMISERSKFLAETARPKNKSRLAALVSVPESNVFDTVCMAVWKLLLMTSVDPDRNQAVIAHRVVDAILAKKPIYPPCSMLFEKRRRYFAEPQLQPAETRQPGSVRDLERRWVFERNHNMVVQSREVYEAIPNQSWYQALTFNLPLTKAPVEKRPSLKALRVHAFEEVLCVSRGCHVEAWEIPGLGTPSKPNERQSLSAPNLLCSLDHGSIPATGLEIIHEDAYSMLVVGSADGTVRIWRDFIPYRTSYPRDQEGLVPPLVPSMVSSWRALPDLTEPRVKGASPDSLVLKWISPSSSLAVAGPSRVVRVWDLERDQPLHSIHTRSSASVTSLACDVLGSPDVLITGGADGSVRVLDIRLRPMDALVTQLKEHPSWCVGVDVGQCPPLLGTQMDSGTLLASKVVSASAAGDIKVWDLRAPARSITTVNVFSQNASLSSFALHPYAPVAVSGSATQQLKIVDLRRGGQVAHTVTHYDGFLGQRLGKVCCAAFHPLWGSFAIGAGSPSSPTVTVYRSI